MAIITKGSCTDLFTAFVDKREWFAEVVGLGIVFAVLGYAFISSYRLFAYVVDGIDIDVCRAWLC